MEEFPAARMGLVLWDHGGGSVAGFGDDERFADGTLTLAEMDWAFEEAGLAGRKLDFLGFDACLMATVEMGVVAARYAHYLVASQDLEPGDGWDYVFLSALNWTPTVEARELCMVIVDTFMDFYGDDSDEILTLSVVDLAKVDAVMDAMGWLMAAAGDELAQRDGFGALATRRAFTKTFGEGSPRDNYADMVDIGDMAVQLADMFPREAGLVRRALRQCVVYNRHNADVDLWGLAAFYIFGGKSLGEESLAVYADLDMDAAYTQYLFDFFDELVLGWDEVVQREWVLWQPMTEDVYRMVGLAEQWGGNPRTNAHGDAAPHIGNMVASDASPQDMLWPFIDGHAAIFFPAGTTKKGLQYAVPARVNGRDADLIVAMCTRTDAYRILGARQYDGLVKQKGYDPVRHGDTVCLYSLEYNWLTDTTRWLRGRSFTVNGALQLQWMATPPGYEVGERFTTLSNEVKYRFDYFPAHQLSAFSSSSWNCGLCQTGRWCPGVSTHTRPLPRLTA